MIKGRLSKEEKKSISKQLLEGISVEVIAEKHGRSVSAIGNYVASLSPIETIETKSGEPETEKKKKNNTMFVRKTASKKDKGVSIMTGAESERADDLKKAREQKQSKIGSRFTGTIHRIFDEED